MNHFDKKIGKIIDELTTYLLKKNCNNIDISIKKSEEEVHLIFNFDFICSKLIDMLEETLSQERDESMEEYGWELLGENDCSGELNLIGMCIDDLNVEIDGNHARIELIRKL
ncbi:MAG: hypothetical protein ACK5NF_04605 [Bacilli bacterium]